MSGSRPRGGDAETGGDGAGSGPRSRGGDADQGLAAGLRRRARQAVMPAIEVARTYGARGLARRAAHEVKRRTGWYERGAAGDAEVGALRLLRVDVGAVAALQARFPAARAQAIDDAERLLRGAWPFFGGPWLETGWPPRWHEDARTRQAVPADRPWTASASVGFDIKWLWEPSRLFAAWSLPRAWVATGERRYLDETWRLLHDWWRHNPPGRGATWYCAQELTFRSLAMLFAASAFGRASAPADVARLAAFLGVAAARIERTLGHGLSQRNNHGLSEAAGLWAIGAVLPDAPGAARWRARGAAALAECVRDQFAPDGGYIQDSFNYHRLAVHVLLVARWVARSTGEALPAEVEPALRASHALLARVADGGVLPNHGHNDGALLLPLSSCAYRDARPLLAHLAHDLGVPATAGGAPLEAGPWDEPAAWLGVARREAERAADPAGAAPDRGALHLSSSGYLTSRHGALGVFAHVPLRRDHRPAHADALHVDVTLDGPLALDPGTFAYSEPPPWDNGLAATRVHNTGSVGERSQMRRRGKFLWTDWSTATLHAQHRTAGASLWLASVRAAWGRDVVHTRLVRHDAARVDVLDHLGGGRAGDVLRVHWNLAGAAWRREGERWTDGRRQVHLAAAPGLAAEARAVVADPAGVLGWWSPTYGVREPCTALELEVRGEAASFHTCFAAAGPPPAPLPDDVRAAWHAGDLAAAFDAWTR